MTPTYRIRNWDECFECAQTRKLKRGLSFVMMPTCHDTKGYKRLMRHERGLELYGAWCLIVQVAAKCRTRGVLCDEDGPLSAEDLSLKTDGNSAVFAQALRVLSDPSIGWLEVSQDGSAADSGRAVVEHSHTTTRPRPTRGGEGKGEGRVGRERDAGNGRPLPHLKKTAETTGAVLADVDGGMLRDSKRLAAWTSRAITSGLLPELEITQLRVFSAAETALRRDIPAAAFVAMVRDQDWESSNAADEDRARTRIREIDKRPAHPAIANAVTAGGRKSMSQELVDASAGGDE